MTNSWINHAKLFAAKHRLKYADALKHPACKMSYYSSDDKNKRILLKGGDKTRKFTCTSCGQRKSTDERFLSPRRCLNENGNPLQSPYRICKQCWWLFADENAHNPCPGCVNNLPFRRTRRSRRIVQLESRRLRNSENPPPMIEVLDDSDDD